MYFFKKWISFKSLLFFLIKLRRILSPIKNNIEYFTFLALVLYLKNGRKREKAISLISLYLSLCFYNLFANFFVANTNTILVNHIKSNVFLWNFLISINYFNAFSCFTLSYLLILFIKIQSNFNIPSLPSTKLIDLCGFQSSDSFNLGLIIFLSFSIQGNFSFFSASSFRWSRFKFSIFF